MLYLSQIIQNVGISGLWKRRLNCNQPTMCQAWWPALCPFIHLDRFEFLEDRSNLIPFLNPQHRRVPVTQQMLNIFSVFRFCLYCCFRNDRNKTQLCAMFVSWSWEVSELTFIPSLPKSRPLSCAKSQGLEQLRGVPCLGALEPGGCSLRIHFLYQTHCGMQRLI